MESIQVDSDGRSDIHGSDGMVTTGMSKVETYPKVRCLIQVVVIRRMHMYTINSIYYMSKSTERYKVQDYEV